MKKEKIKKELNLFLGYTCNNNCWFCSEALNKGKPERSTVDIKTELFSSRKKGIQRVVFTGGEPTIRTDIYKLISYANFLGFEEIFIITNGRMLFYKEFVKRMIRAGLTHILFSLHAPTAEVHDYLTRSPCSFEQIWGGIKNMLELKDMMKTRRVMVQNNTVITRKNYKYLPELAKLLVESGFDFYEFILVNPMSIAYTHPNKFEEFVPRLYKIEEYVHKALDVGIKKEVRCTAEGIPLCYMNGYEKYVTELNMCPERIITGPDNRYVPDVNKSRKENSKVKAEICKKCKYYLICEGIWGHYADHYGTEELKPVRGEYVQNLEQLELQY
jgi:MoaA/NifB/PqqE/SkfB family radical SAM enzyme